MNFNDGCPTLPIMLQQWGGSLAKDPQLLLHRGRIVVRTLGTVAAHIRPNPRQHGFLGTLQIDYRLHVNDSVDFAGLPQVPRQTVQHEPDVATTAAAP